MLVTFKAVEYINKYTCVLKILLGYITKLLEVVTVEVYELSVLHSSIFLSLL